MQRFRLLSTVLLIPAVAVLVASAGCGGGETEKPKTGTSGGAATSGKGGTTKTEGAGKSSGAKTEVASTGSATLRGKVTFDGDPPKAQPIDFSKKPEDAPYCKMGPPADTTMPTWRVGPDKGVGNVIVWLQPPRDSYFKIPDSQKDRSDTVTVGQPFCAFEPHVFALFPSYFDGKQQKKTGQEFKVINNAEIAHNTNVTFSDPTLNSGDNKLLPKKTGNDVKELVFDVKPCKDRDCGKSQNVSITCNIHPWMSAYGRIFDHPYFAITSGGSDKDKEFGVYEIKDAPAGAEVEIMYWHESMSAPKVLEKITLKDKETTTKDFKIK